MFFQARFVILAAFLSIITCLGGLWLSASADLVRPMIDPSSAAQTPQPIPNGADDVSQFFKSLGYKGAFQVITAARDATLGRRCYQVRIDAGETETLQAAIMRGWTWGHFNRGVYENCASARIPHSRNLPRWWKQDAQYANCLMLDHGGVPSWYVVMQPGGEVDLMWSSR